MNQAKTIIPRLRRLVELETVQRQISKNEDAGASLAAEIESLRGLLPTSILSHHDQRRARGKVSVAPVTRGVCGACHLAIPRGRHLQLRRIADDLSVCDHCGVFIYLAEEDQSTAATLAERVPRELKKVAGAKRSSRRTQTTDTEIVPSR